MASTPWTSATEAAIQGNTSATAEDDPSGHIPPPDAHQPAVFADDHPNSAVEPLDIADQIRLVFMLFQNTGFRSYFKAAVEKLKKARPRPYTRYRGTIAFLNIDESLSEVDCINVVAENEALQPQRPLYNPVMVKHVHEILRGPSEEDEEIMLGHNLGFAGLYEFLDMCQYNIKPDHHPNVTKQWVKAILAFTYSRELEKLRMERRRIEQHVNELFEKDDTLIAQLSLDNFIKGCKSQAEKDRAQHALDTLINISQERFVSETQWARGALEYHGALEERLLRLLVDLEVGERPAN